MSFKQTSLLDRYVLQRSSIRTILLCAFHAAVFTGCYLFAWLVRFEFSIPAKEIPGIRSSLPIVVGIQLVVGVGFGFYRGWWRYVGISDVIRLVWGLTTAQALLFLLWYAGQSLGLRGALGGASRGALLIDWAFALLALFGSRVAIRIGRDRTRARDPLAERRRVVIVGAGDTGETLAREIEHRPTLEMKVVAFVDDDRSKWGSHIRGINVLGPISTIDEIATKRRATEALIAIPSADGRRMREVVRSVAEAHLRFRTIPGLDQLVSGHVDLSQLRPVNVDDLIRRARIDLPGDPVRRMIHGTRVLVTGAGGSIGSELVLQTLQYEPESIILLERSEYALYEITRRIRKERPSQVSSLHPRLGDMRDSGEIERILESLKPEVVLHAAAHKHVPMGEENPAEYLRNNCLAAHSFARLCADRGVRRFVFVSTDKAIRPSSVMGATKRAAEILLIDLARSVPMEMTVVRFGNVIGSSGSVVPLFREQIADGGPVTVTDPEVSRYFLRTSEAVSLVLQAATLGSSGRVYMLDMGDPIRIADLAKDLILLSGKTDSEIPIVFTGLRPGEKLLEEIRLDGELTHPTSHPQIVVTEAPQPDEAEVRGWLERVERLRWDGDAAIQLLRALVPEFHPTPGGETTTQATSAERTRDDPST